MKKVLLLAAIAISTFFSQAQTNVTLQINHFFGGEDFALDAVAENNLGQEYILTRLEYYLSKITLVHDGGMETPVSLDVIALVNPGDEIATSIPLGSFDVTTVEAVKFHIGVYTPVNNEDPSLYADGHPLALQDPSMHWGWASGYRFLAMEGEGEAGEGSTFQIHALGNENYFETTVEVTTEADGDDLIVHIDANYEAGMHELDANAGTFAHGAIGEAKTALENFRDLVFGTYTASIPENESLFEWNIYPNPSTNPEVNVRFENNTENLTLQVSNAAGEIVNNYIVSNDNIITVSLNEAGTYIFSVIKEGKIIETNQVVIQ